MDKTSLLNEIKAALEGLLSQTQQLEKEEQPVHQIDKDLLLEKTRALYEQMLALENAGHEEKAPVPELTQEEDVPVAEETAETVVEEKEMSSELPADENQEIPDTKPEEIVPEREEKTKEEKVPVTVEEVAEPKMKEEPDEEKPEPIEETKKSVEPPKTMLDLFSEAPSETLGDTLMPAEKPAVVDRLQMSGINDLREAIGINDKFLFVNELFNGDLERYNKVIDELNGFSGLSGAQTYLTELQVQYQWIENAPAYQKLNVLLERKFT
ncbi:hypothetical protein MNBD_BACTEROID07-978 [hydrothermal vent metagenome]|uniref:MJ0042 family finger-like protein n=1 Tax=hydrothermal vent metagenome TaxID=652676 RepID=A0A3B0U701_9ZZZZ